MQDIAVAPVNLPVAVPLDQRAANCAINRARGLPRLIDMPEVGLERLGAAALVSGGPSAIDYLTEIQQFDAVVACGSSHDWLIGQGIIPTYCVIFDPGAGQARLYTPHPAVTYLVASTCDPSLFDKLAGFAVRIWTPVDERDFDDGEPRVGGGSTVTLRAVAIAHIIGLRSMHLFGFDCCYRDGAEHAYPYAQDRPEAVTVSFNGRIFITTPQLLQQAQEFLRMYFDHQHEMAIAIYGDGLIKAMWQQSTMVSFGEFGELGCQLG